MVYLVYLQAVLSGFFGQYISPRQSTVFILFMKCSVGAPVNTDTGLPEIFSIPIYQ
jgi:hypothetical protein